MANVPNKELGGARKMSTGTKVVIGVFAVIMALSMMLPSLSAIFASDNAAEQAEQADDEVDVETEDAETDDADEADDADADADTDASDDDADADDADTDADDEADADADYDGPDNDSLKSLAASYTDDVKELEARLKENPKDLAALLNLGQAYMNWGYSASYTGTTDDEKAYANGLLGKAIGYFDDYLKLHDSVAVRVDQALCVYYQDKHDEGIKQLKAITESDPDFPVAWANLGMMLESEGQTDEATAAYRKAIKLDKDDEYGVKSYANQRIISLNSKISSLDDTGDADLDKIDTAPSPGISSALKNDAAI